MSDDPDETYYARLEAGAAYLAEEAADPAARARHLKMAELYGDRAREAAPAQAPSGTVH